MPEPFVSVIIPCRNEERFIARCLDSVLAQKYSPDRVEILLAEGMSEDATRDILKDYAKRHANVHWFENPARITPVGLNILIRRARGEIIIRLDAHSLYPNNYISHCVRYLNEYKVDNVGGVWKTKPGANTHVAQAIAFALTSPFGVGGSKFRLGVGEPTFTETVPFGCYRKEIFGRIGFFNEKIIRNEDNEFNARLVEAGGKILLHPAINCSYFARPDIHSVAKQHFQNGFRCIYSLKFSKRPFFPRHLVPMSCVIFLGLSMILGIWLKCLFWVGIVSIGLYFFGIFVASAILAANHGARYFPYLLIVFPSLHIPYGIGSLWGIVKLLMPEKNK